MQDPNDNIRLDIIDFSFARVTGNKKLLKPFTSFRIPGAHFSKLYKQKKWDGTVSIIKYNNLPIGLIPYFLEEAGKRGIDVHIYADGQRLSAGDIRKEIFSPLDVSRSTMADLAKNLPEAIKPRFYQLDALEASLTSARGMIVLPTGGGKSLSIYMTAYLLRSRYNLGLVIAPRTSLVDQLTESFSIFSSNTIEALPTSEYGSAVFNMLDPTGPNIIITTWQSWTRWMQNGTAPAPDYVLVDEAHTIASKQMPWNFMKAFKTTKARYGFTATENDLDHERLTLIGLMGPVLYREKAESLIKKKFLAHPKIAQIRIHHTDPPLGKYTSRDLVQSPHRMQWMCSFVDSTLPDGKAMLILTEAVDAELKPLAALLNENLGHDIDVLTMTSTTSRAQRKEVIAQVDSPTRRTVLVVTYGLFQMGIDISSLGHIVFHSPSKSYIRVVQSAGRGLRPKDTCFIYDLVDVVPGRSCSGAEKRLRIYEGAYGDQMTLINSDVHI